MLLPIRVVFKFFMVSFEPFFIGSLIVLLAGIREKKIIPVKIL